jgi:hypothetical protein
VKVIVCGSRDWEGVYAEARIQEVLTSVQDLTKLIRSPLVIRHGGCPTGADAIADRWARRRGYEPEVFKADWATYRRAAGPFRNSSMAKAGADMCLAFLREESSGTRDMIEKARAEKIPTFVIPWEEGYES